MTTVTVKRTDNFDLSRDRLQGVANVMRLSDAALTDWETGSDAETLIDRLSDLSDEDFDSECERMVFS